MYSFHLTLSLLLLLGHIWWSEVKLLHMIKLLGCICQAAISPPPNKHTQTHSTSTVAKVEVNLICLRSCCSLTESISYYETDMFISEISGPAATMQNNTHFVKRQSVNVLDDSRGQSVSSDWNHVLWRIKQEALVIAGILHTQSYSYVRNYTNRSP